MTDIRPGCRTILLILSLLVTGSLVQTGAVASDRDTPAYRIYVDPETGRYRTTPPDQRRQGTAVVQATDAFATGATADNAPTATNLRRPFTAALLLVLIAAASLPIRSRHTDQASEGRSK